MRKLIIFLFSAIQILVSGQERVVEIAWNTDSLLSFRGAAFQEQSGTLPLYSLVLPWMDDGKIPVVKTTVNNASRLKAEYYDQIRPEHLSFTPGTTYRLVFENRRPHLHVSVVPFFIDSTTGMTMKLESFSLRISDEQPMAALKAKKKGLFSGSSVLAEGNWYKVSVDQSGIHKLTYEKLQELGIANPAMVKIFGAGAVQLPENYNEGSYDDLAEIPVYMNKGSDQLFGPGDYILFYARGPVKWNYYQGINFFMQQVHKYSNHGYYYITDSRGTAQSPAAAQVTGEPAGTVVTSYDLYAHLEEEKFNLLRSGKEWYGDNFKINLSAAYPFTLDNLVTTEPLKISVTAAARSNASSSMKVAANNTTLGYLNFNPVNLSSYTSIFAIENNNKFLYNATQEIVTVQVEYLSPNSNSEAWLNYITINGRARLEMTGDQLTFRDTRSTGSGNISEFRITNINTNTKIWDITDPDNPLSVPLQRTGDSGSFRIPTSQLREFIAFNPGGNFPEPETDGPGTGRLKNQNLHGMAPPEMLIIYAAEFEQQASRLANHRRNHDNLSVEMVTQEMIFNEFSSGTPDVSAIRNYLKMYYDSYPEEQMVRYLLLFGDGSFDNRDTASYNPNLIITYQSANSLTPTSSYVSDDFFGLLDTGEDLYDGMLDIGIGRLPASTVEDADLLVNKLIEYDSPENLGEWRNFICLIGDDEDRNIHMVQANSIADYIEENHPDYNINKIFLDAYYQLTTPTGDLYPDVNKAINDQMNRGALIINYTGHGGVGGLAHEKILDVSNIKAWRNKGRYPLFMTATCEFSRYDWYDPGKKEEITTAGEDVLLNPRGGSIALFTTTRLVYSGPNHVLNEKFYEIVFNKKEDGEGYRLGDIIKYSKNNAGAGINKRNFTLLGDPSTILSFPKHLVVTDSVNHQPVETFSDTISALEYVTVSGQIQNRKGELMEQFNGMVTPIVYDKKAILKTLANDGGTPMDFTTRNSILYKGNATVEHGRFNFSFYVPKDIGYNMGDGKISYYGFSEETDAHGSSQGITIGGLGDFSELDSIGPDIQVFMNDTLFRNGGIVDNTPELLVYVRDPYGINTTGNGIGHDITATLNDDRINAVILNEYYQAESDSYSSGTIRYPYNSLPEGRHTVMVKVWDIFNNSATASLDFVVMESAKLLLEEVYNYPNPFVDETFFNIEHNRPGEELEIVIRIYDLSGNLVHLLQNQVYSSGYRIDPPSWQGNTHDGATLGGGLYVYKVIVRSESGEEAAGAGRLIIKR